MLVILNTVEAIRKRYIATQINNVLNSKHQYAIGDFTVDYTVNPYEIFDNTGKLVYRAGNGKVTGESSILRGYGRAGLVALKQAEELEREIMTNSMKYHLATMFSDPYHELAETEAPEYVGEFQHVLDLYAEKTTEHLVLSGTYSKTFIEKIKAEMGDDVHILNVTRNPSVAYMVDDTHLGKTLKDAVLKNIGMRLFSSMLNAAQLKKLSYVTTIKFEDILRDGGFTFQDKFIPLDYDNFNNIISKFEKTVTLIEEGNISKRDDLATFNDVMSNHDKYHPEFSYVPNNLFEELGYNSPITLSEMITPLADDANSQP